jgi:uncharacterized protein (TIGR03435 family)
MLADMKFVASLLLLIALQTAPSTSFEAASIRPNTSGETRVRFEMPPGRLNAVNVPIRFAIRQAYRVPEARVVGGPAWLDKERFDILATAPGVTGGDAIRERLRTLLKDRFGLAIRMETREMPVYALTVARKDGRLEKGLRVSSTDCTGKSSSMVGGRVECGILVSEGPGSASLRGGGTTIANIARFLGEFLDRPLNDHTGLTGVFDFELHFTTVLSPGANDIPDIFVAVPEQMGLKLDAREERAEVWIIDSISQPKLD